MSESQNIEWKQAWHEDYLKWVCGFANAVGGTIYIGKNDAWGRGTLKILNACKEAELPEPEIIEKDGGVQVTIFKAISSIEAKDAILIGGPIGGPINSKGVLQAAQLTIRQVEILEIIRSNTKISRRKLAEQLEINVSAVQGHLDLLKEKGVLSRKGGTRGIWVILQQGDSQDSL